MTKQEEFQQKFLELMERIVVLLEGDQQRLFDEVDARLEGAKFMARFVRGEEKS